MHLRVRITLLTQDTKQHDIPSKTHTYIRLQGLPLRAVLTRFMRARPVTI